MNARQRNKNRKNADALRRKAREIELSKHICENCGKPGGHWVSIRGRSLQAIMDGTDDSQGFWTCEHLYGPDGRRLDTSDSLLMSSSEVVGLFAMSQACRKDSAIMPKGGADER